MPEMTNKTMLKIACAIWLGFMASYFTTNLLHKASRSVAAERTE